jgi:hypothetical protein
MPPTTKKLKENDRVRRIGLPGCAGIVKQVRQETTASTVEQKEDALLVTVLWDNGTISYFSPTALEVVS